MRTLLSLLGIAVLGVGVPTTAHASPWTLRQGEVAVVAAFDYQWARREFLDEYDSQVFPLNGRYTAASMILGARAGFTDRLELEIQVPIKLVSYQSDPVILLGDEMSGIDALQENVIDLSRTRRGIGDIWITGRYNLLRNPLALAIEARLKTPTGYDPPEGTFGDRPRNTEEFLANINTFVAPGNVRDDVALGDGQVDLNVNFLLGASFPSRTFIRFDGGYNLRVRAGDQIVGSFKLGQAIGQKILVYGDVSGGYTVEDGDVIGVSVAAIDPTLPASEYGGTTNLRLREVQLERDFLSLAVGGIVRITDSVEMNVGYSRVLIGRNTSQVNGVFVSIGVRTNLLEQPDEEEYEEEYEEEAYAEDEGYEEDEAYEEQPVESPVPIEAPAEEPAPVETEPVPQQDTDESLDAL